MFKLSKSPRQKLVAVWPTPAVQPAAAPAQPAQPLSCTEATNLYLPSESRWVAHAVMHIESGDNRSNHNYNPAPGDDS
jgi:hypothetical protein